MSTSPSLQPDPERAPAPRPALVEPPPQERSWAFTASGQQPAFAWAVAAALGVVAISAAPRDTLIRLLLPVCIMFGYVFISYPRESSPGTGLRSARVAQLADSSYFLGFLWTLWALIDSFVLKKATGAETAFRVFGYALVTTAAGMATRLYLLQFKYGAEEQTAEAEFTVERNLQIFAAVMQDASRSLQSFQADIVLLNAKVRELSKALDDVDRRFTDTHEETTKAIKDNIATVVEDIRTAMKNPIQEYGRAIRSFTATIDHQSRLLAETVQKSSEDVGQTVKEAAGRARTIIQETEERIGQEHLELATRLRTQTEQIVKQLQALGEKLGILNLPGENLTRFVQCLTDFQGMLVTLTGLLRPEGELRVSLSSFADAIRSQGTALGRALADVVARLNSIRLPSEIAIDVTEVRRAIEELQRAVEGLLEKTADQRWERAPQVTSEALLKLSASATNLRHTLDATNTSAKKTAPTEERRKKKHFWQRW